MARNGLANSRSSDASDGPNIVPGRPGGDSDGSGDALGGAGSIGGRGHAESASGDVDGGRDGASGSDGGSGTDSAIGVGHRSGDTDTGTDTGTGTGTDSGDGSGSAKRKRGRPTNAERNAGLAVESAVRVRKPREPKSVGLGALGLGGEKGSVKFGDVYSGGAKLAFSVPKYAGLGEHWSLADDEADDLGAAVAAFVKTLPKAQRARWEKKIEKWFPGINLVVVAGMLTVPRVMVTLELMKMQQAAQQARVSPPSDSRYGTEQQYASPVPSAHDVRDVIERSQGIASPDGAPVHSGSVSEV